jgi:anaerobic magnesium-protoporphyrin IX monomethyl ester cyclase
LIWPHGLGEHLLPLPYAAIAANMDRSTCEARLFDLALGMPEPEKLESEIAEFAPDVIGITAHAMNFRQALDAVRAARRAAPNAVVLAGGPHASACPEGVLGNPEIDFVIRGEAEHAFPAFMAELRSGTPIWENVAGLARIKDGRLSAAPPAVIEDLDSLALPDYRFIRLDLYLRRGYRLFCDGTPSAPIQTTRGCPMCCTFCGVSAVSGRRLRHFSYPYMMRWINRLHEDFGIRWFNIVDDNFTHNMDHARGFCEAALRLKIPGLRFGTPNGIRMQRGDAGLWRLMRRAGWDCLTVAPESGSARVLRQMKKDLLPEEVVPILEEIRAAGLRTRGFFMVGYPGETPEDVEETLALIRRGRFDFVELLFFQPLPGTRIFEELAGSGEIPPDFMPDTFSSGELPYMPAGLKGMNFNWLSLKVRLGVVLRGPGAMLLFLRYADLRAGAGRLIRQVLKGFLFVLGKK